MSNPIRKPMCIVPARGGSKRLPRKNIALLGGKPLLAWTIDAAHASGIFDVVWVSTEDAEVMAVAERFGARPLARSPELAGDRVTQEQLCQRVAREILVKDPTYTDLYVLLPTSPFRRPETIRAVWAAFVNSDAECLFSTEPVPHPPQWALTESGGWLKPLFPDQFDVPRQALSPAVRHEGGHAIARLPFFLEHGAFLGPRTMAFPVPRKERMDIDELEDLELADFRLQKKAL